MRIKHLLIGIFITALTLNVLPVFADNERNCRLMGTYGYLYNGTTYSLGAVPVPLTETGFFKIDREGNITGEGQLAFYFSDFNGLGPLWLLLHEVQTSGEIVANDSEPCTGTGDLLATATVIKTSNPALVPEGFVLFKDSPRSLAYTISGKKYDTVDVISTSPGTIASGTARKQGRRSRFHH